MSYTTVMKKPEAAPKSSSKVAVGDSHSSFEQEADRVADQVVNGSKPSFSLSKISVGPLQRQDTGQKQDEAQPPKADPGADKKKGEKPAPPTQADKKEDPKPVLKPPVKFDPLIHHDVTPPGPRRRPDDSNLPPDFWKPTPKREQKGPFDGLPSGIPLGPGTLAPSGGLKSPGLTYKGTWDTIPKKHKHVDPVPDPPADKTPDPAPPKVNQSDPLRNPKIDLPKFPKPEPVPDEIPRNKNVAMAKAERPLSSEVDRSIIESAMSGGGKSLSPETRRFMESKIGYDFRHVRIHEGAQAAASAKTIGARAYTLGSDIVFGESRYAPNTTEGRRLLAHELTHVVQQAPAAKRAAPTVAPAVVSRAPVHVQRDGEDDDHSGWLDELWKKLKNAATNIPGYKMLSVIIGRDPLTGEHVERNAMNVLEGICGLVPGGEAAFSNLKESGALEKAFAWVDEELTKLGLTWEYFKALVKRVADGFSWHDVFNISGAIARVGRFFAEPFDKVKQFASDALDKLLEFIVSVALDKLGGQKIIDLFKKAAATFKIIYKDPIAFLKNLLTSMKMGFQQFLDHILEHLKQGLMKWVFGEVASTGIKLPEKWDLAGIVGLVLQVLGLSYQKLRTKLVKQLGEKAVKFIETAFEVVVVLVKQGIGGLWKMIIEKADNLIDSVINGIRDWAVSKIITAAVTKLVTMFNPVGAVVQAIKVTYDTITFLMEKINQIADLVNSILDSISEIAAGNLARAANFVESTMAKTVPVIIGFLASLIGLGGIGKKIAEIIKSLQAKVDMALDKIIAYIAEKGKALFAKAKDAAGQALAWWKMRKKMDVSGKPMEIYFEGPDAAPKLMISRSPGRPWSQYLDDNKVPKDKKKDWEAAKALAKLLEEPVRESGGKSKDDAYDEKQKNFTKLADLLEKLGYMDKKAPASRIDYGEVSDLQGGSSATASILSSEHPQGSGPRDSDKADIWEVLGPTLRAKQDYVRGHLLNENLGGPGERYNLTPITRGNNNKHKSQVEAHIKQAVNVDKDVVYYRVTPKYPAVSKDPKKSKAQNMNDSLCTHFEIENYYLEQDNDQWGPPKKGGKKPVAGVEPQQTKFKIPTR